MKINAPDILLQELTFTASTQWSTVKVSVPLNGLSTSDIINSATAFQLIADEECSLEVSSAWIELVESKDISVQGQWNSQLLPKTVESKSLQTSSLAIDLSELINTNNRWKTFYGDGDGLQVRFQLLNPEQGFAISLQNVRFETMVRPARSIRLTSNLYVDVDGLATEVDGHCNPATVIRELISSSRFFGDGTPWNEPEFNSTYNALASSGIRFNGLFRSSLKLTQLLESAFEESLLWMNTTEQPYRFNLFSSTLGVETSVILNRDNQLESGCHISTTPPDLCADTVILTKQSTGDLLYRKAINTGRGTETWPTRWISKGFDQLLQFVVDEFSHPLQLLHCKTPGSLVDTGVASLVKAEGFPDQNTSFDALVQSKKWRNGIVDFVCRRRPEIFLLWSDGPAKLYGRYSPSVFRFTVFDQVVLSLANNQLQTSLSIREGALEDIYPLGLFWNDEDESISLMTTNGVSQVGFVMQLSGQLITTHDIIESPFSDIEASQPVEISDELLTLSMPGNQPVIHINAQNNLIQFFFELSTT